MTENSQISKPSDDYSCNHCEEKFKTEKGLNIHIGKIHKDSSPEKEHVAVEEEFSPNITPIKEVRDEPPDEEQSVSQQVCTMCNDLWGPLTKPSYKSVNYVDRTRWNCLCSRCWI